jgi:protease I
MFAGRFRLLLGLPLLLLAFLHELLVADHLADDLLGSSLGFLSEFGHDGPPVRKTGRARNVSSSVDQIGAPQERCLGLSIDRGPPKYSRSVDMDLNGKKIAILATNGFEQSELEVPRDRLKKAGATVDVVSLAAGEIKGWDKKDWGRPVKVDKTLDQISASDYDALVLPGGQINPDLLRVEPKALKFIKDIFDAKKIVAAVCHAPWLLIETGIAKGRKMTSYKSIKTDVVNAGGKWEDSQVVVNQGVITSRNPGDLEAFSAKIIEEIREGRHTQRSAA